MEPEKRIKRRAAKLNFAQATDNSSLYRTTGMPSVIDQLEIGEGDNNQI
jgi:hypothetical protein